MENNNDFSENSDSTLNSINKSTFLNQSFINSIINSASSSESDSEEADMEASISGEILLMMLLLNLSLIVGYFTKKKKFILLNDSLCATFLGLVAGFFMYILDNKKYMNNISHGYARFFMIIFLPPIIFQSAYNLNRSDFFRNLGTISLYAVLGTLITIFTIAFILLGFSKLEVMDLNFNLQECVAFGSIIAATDPICIMSAFKEFSIDPNFYQIVFGESLMNDAVSIVFYEASNKITDAGYFGKDLVISLGKFILVMIGSIVLGYLIGYLTASLIKLMSAKRVKNIQSIEVGLVMILPWVSYLLAQMCYLSGIVAILFNALANSTYTKPNITEYSNYVSTKYQFNKYY